MRRPFESLTPEARPVKLHLPAVALSTALMSAVSLATDHPHVKRIKSAVGDGGVLHLSSGEWTSSVEGAMPGSGVIYNSTATGPDLYVFDLSPGIGFTDDGRIPSASGPSDYRWNRPGCASSYVVSGFQIMYCTQNTVQDAEIRFFEAYSPCSDPNSYAPVASFILPNLPASPVQGTWAVWIVTVDLRGDPDLSFAIQADRDGDYEPASGEGNTSGGLDRFGWTLRFTGPGSGDAGSVIIGQATPYVTGAPGIVRGFDGTLWDPLPVPGEPGIGMSTTDLFYLENFGCTQFTLGSGYLRLFTSTNCPPRPGSAFCFGDGTGTSCPCGTGGPDHESGYGEGCTNHLIAPGSAVNSWLRTEGVASLSTDTLLLHATAIPPNTTALFFQGTQRVNGGNGSVFGDGLRCAGGAIRRLGMNVASAAGRAIYPDVGDLPVSAQGQISEPGTRTYQTWFRVAQNFCTPATFNLTNGWEIAWLP